MLAPLRQIALHPTKRRLSGHDSNVGGGGQRRHSWGQYPKCKQVAILMLDFSSVILYDLKGIYRSYNIFYIFSTMHLVLGKHGRAVYDQGSYGSNQSTL